MRALGNVKMRDHWDHQNEGPHKQVMVLISHRQYVKEAVPHFRRSQTKLLKSLFSATVSHPFDDRI